MWINLSVKEETFKKYLKQLQITAIIKNFLNLINVIKDRLREDLIQFSDENIKYIAKGGDKIKISKEYFLYLCISNKLKTVLSIKKIVYDIKYIEIAERIYAIKALNITKFREKAFQKYILSNYTFSEILLSKEIEIPLKKQKENMKLMRRYINSLNIGFIRRVYLNYGLLKYIKSKEYFNIILNFSIKFWNL